ncbi:MULTISPECIES: ArsR/SmtB family transcription factor [Haloferax]|uniref:ArsR family transcriptional regulator n=3 Tax=Haloferax TaxID=2251 RepID=M0IF60_9EURY|nr:MULTISPECIES: metalloregulator ArsR/SmtB family transcription factor [Haloferax]ELZ94707.1 ArsR family transcriptional regulator [Haloferax sulfurifontis ATCC BAA-897]EMA04261.1 ArsR family transcriptional regulator [Haloferax denitrificans ATCC 35960]GGC45363.1 MarR family transcriptional regulator [Haloferax sulfurifontis]
MDSAVLLDLLGNENRRRILRLLSHKPCYVTEISEYLGVSPKAVIDHLRKLEDAGLIESRTDDQRRKYFHISRNLRLEVNVSPYGFGAKSAYPPSPSLDMAGRCPHVTLEVENAGSDDISELARELGKLEELDNELSLAQRWVQGRITDVLDRLNDRLGVDADSRFYAEILAALANGSNTVRGIAKDLNADPAVVDSALHHLAEGDLVAHNGDRWRID